MLEQPCTSCQFHGFRDILLTFILLSPKQMLERFSITEKNAGSLLLLKCRKDIPEGSFDPLDSGLSFSKLILQVSCLNYKLNIGIYILIKQQKLIRTEHFIMQTF